MPGDIHVGSERIVGSMPPVDPDATEHIPPVAASTYAKLAASYGQPYYRSVAEDVAGLARPGDRVLDAGTGPGYLPVALAERTADVRIHAFDVTRELLECGREEAARRGVDRRVSFFAGDCYAVPVRDRRYALVTATGVLHALEEPARALAEFHRVLEPAGTAWISDPAILDAPENPDIELTAHEREVFRAYGVRSADEERPLPTAEARRLAAESPFDDATVEVGEPGDVRLRLSRRV